MTLQFAVIKSGSRRVVVQDEQPETVIVHDRAGYWGDINDGPNFYKIGTNPRMPRPSEIPGENFLGTVMVFDGDNPLHWLCVGNVARELRA
jgi:hypothetical protein